MKAHEYLKKIFQLSPVGSIILHPEKNEFVVLDANFAFIKQLKLPQNEIIGMPISAIYPKEMLPFGNPNILDLVLESLQLVQSSKETQLISDIPFIQTDTESLENASKFLSIENIPLLDANGNLEYILHTIQDVSDKNLANKTLHEEELKFQFVLENTSDAVMVIGSDHHIKYVTPAYYKQLGYSEQEDIGRSPESIYNLVHVEDRDFLFSNIFNAIEHKKPGLLYSYRVLNSSGNYIWREDHAKFNYSETGDFISAFVICRDISYRKQIEMDLEETKEKYRGLSEASFESIFISEKGVCIEQNLAAEKMFGYTNEEALGRMGTEWIAPDYRELVMKNMISGYEEPYEAVALKKDGSTFPCLLMGKMMHYKGRYVRVTSLSDITLRKNAENEIRKNNERYNLVTKATHDSIWDLDIKTGEINRIGDGFELLFGYQIDFDFKKSSELINFIHPDDFERVIADLQEAYLNPLNNLWVCEFRVLKKDGGIAHVHDNGYIIRNEQGEAIRMIGATRDVTDRVNYVKAIEEQNAKLKEIAWVQSHIVRAPLARIMGLIELINDGNQVDLETRQLLGYILSSAQEFDQIIKKIIENAKAEEVRETKTFQPNHLI